MWKIKNSVMPEPRGPGEPLAPPYLADQLTLFQPRRADYPHLLPLASPMFSPSGITDIKIKVLRKCKLHNNWPIYLKKKFTKSALKKVKCCYFHKYELQYSKDSSADLGVNFKIVQNRPTVCTKISKNFFAYLSIFLYFWEKIKRCHFSYFEHLS